MELSMQDRLDEVNQEKVSQQLHSFFLASITHEFRTPLSALRASVEYLLDEIDVLSKMEISELLGSIHLSVTGLQTLVDNLLESINIEAGRFTIRPERIDLAVVLSEAVRIMTPLLDRRKQHVSISCPDRLPWVYGDLTHLSQVLVNLLSNASKYGPMEETIDLNIKPNEYGWIIVEVADRGPGIPPAERAHLFRRFMRLGTQNGAQYGIGLGLSVVKAIVEEHGGDVGVKDRPGGGSLFWFSVPLAGE